MRQPSSNKLFDGLILMQTKLKSIAKERVFVLLFFVIRKKERKKKKVAGIILPLTFEICNQMFFRFGDCLVFGLFSLLSGRRR